MSPPNRVDPRLLVHFAAEYRRAGEDEWREGKLYDLSASGAALLTDEPIPLQTLLRVRFTLPASALDEEATFEVEAMGVRKAHRPDLDPGLTHLQGLYFLDLRGERFERVRRFLWERAGGIL